METDALQVREYASSDYPLVNGWWRKRHAFDLNASALPPLGVIVESVGQPVAALWCYMAVGVGVGFFEFAITKPRTRVSQAKEALMMAVEACVGAAKAHAGYSYFRVITSPAMARVMSKLGFIQEPGESKQLVLLRPNG